MCGNIRQCPYDHEEFIMVYEYHSLYCKDWCGRLFFHSELLVSYINHKFQTTLTMFVGVVGFGYQQCGVDDNSHKHSHSSLTTMTLVWEPRLCCMELWHFDNKVPRFHEHSQSSLTTTTLTNACINFPDKTFVNCLHMFQLLLFIFIKRDLCFPNLFKLFKFMVFENL